MKMTKEEREYWEARYKEACIVYDCMDKAGTAAILERYKTDPEVCVYMPVKEFLALSEEQKMSLFFFGATSPRSESISELLTFDEVR